ncbi:putative FAD-linked oxidoreductase [Nocardioides dokdonensis FR1436]|uniref:D-lactate dehydrogenase (cytochrome) n=1 Tax=Nocardioides dokdonensis FR1436 TaxID=1300347 RepID=A0A1A9GH66_9ACTN|nr:FAD-binding oxidoreductase [Nocardioides dokdonensis]ANH37637.1 putative FAD-linked oxidoreductase [Nocardioides dokdonensis FR1436]
MSAPVNHPGLSFEISRQQADLDAHGRDENSSSIVHPAGVVFAESRDDVLAALRYARETGTPVIPWGAGTSADGQVVPRGDELALDVSQMDRVLSHSVEDMTVTVEPGVTRMQLDAHLRSAGVFFPVDPGADATLGGMASTNASGTTTIKYGGMRANVLSLELALVDGRVLRLGRPVRKTSSGYALKDLVVGSGGTLGVISELTLRVHPRPACVQGIRAFFPGVEAATRAAFDVMQSGVPLARLELVDELAIGAVSRYLDLRLPERPALFLELHSSTRAGLAAEVEVVVDLLGEAGVLDIEVATTAEELQQLWKSRHQIWYALIAQYPGRTYTSTDSAVPLSRVPELVEGARSLLAEHRLDAAVFGHVGDGNVHTCVAHTEDQAEDLALYRDALSRLALDLDGTCTGEHGIGTAKRPHLIAEHGEDVVELMRLVRRTFDPDGLMNPGKMFEDRRS